MGVSAASAGRSGLGGAAGGYGEDGTLCEEDGEAGFGAEKRAESGQRERERECLEIEGGWVSSMVG